MAKCKYHNEAEAVGECAICKAKLCEECDEFASQFGRCPKCAKQTVVHLQQNLKRGLLRNVLSVVFAGLFLILFVVYLCLGQLSTTFIIIGSVVIAILLPLTIFMMVYNIKNIKKLGYFIDIADGINNRDENQEKSLNE